MKKHHSTASRVVPHHGSHYGPHHSPPAGLTLVEMLVSMAITLIMMAVVVKLFADIGGGVRIRTATMQMSAQLRSVRQRLSDDLAGATCPPTTWQRQDAAVGYIEIIEGQYSDSFSSILTDGDTTNGELNYSTSLIPGSQLPLAVGDVTDASGLGDYDDILALTVRSSGAPFVGRGLVFNNSTLIWELGTIESNLAEVIWYAVENPEDGSLGEPGLRTIYRRVLLIAPWIDPIDLTAVPVPGGGTLAAGDANRFFQRLDVSARFDPVTLRWVPNTLGDLTKRENRFGHFFVDDPTQANGFPHVLDQSAIQTAATFPTGSLSPLHPFGAPFEILGAADPDRQGEDVMLSDVLAFDLRVFDPGAPLYEVAGAVTEPSDSGWSTSGAIRGYGAFVDMGWRPTAGFAPGVPAAVFAERFSAGWHPTSSPARVYPAVYDTWSFHYENDGLDQYNDGRTDEGTDGLDNDSIKGPDDIDERETAPPYDVSLRGIQVKLRVYDRESRQIREATVTREFVPQ